ncbi:Tyrosine-protein kinase SYK [Nymphon striatum]|nr:Tyrosine-protein kinase SYK [Nymphon striatum]
MIEKAATLEDIEQFDDSVRSFKGKEVQIESKIGAESLFEMHSSRDLELEGSYCEVLHEIGCGAGIKQHWSKGEKGVYTQLYDVIYLRKTKNPNTADVIKTNQGLHDLALWVIEAENTRSEMKRSVLLVRPEPERTRWLPKFLLRYPSGIIILHRRSNILHKWTTLLKAMSYAPTKFQTKLSKDSLRQFQSLREKRKKKKSEKRQRPHTMSAISCMAPDQSQDENSAQTASTYESCDARAWESNPPSQGPIPPESVPYYFEDISRETADLILWDRGCIDGMYLLRKSTNKDADYVLSLCFNNSVLHYRLRTFPDGLVGLTGMPRQKFPGPVELVDNVEGVACKPRIPCCRISSQFAGDLYLGLTKEEVRKIMKQKAQEWDIQDDKLDSQQNENYSDLKSLMMKTIHEYQPWFHGPLTREEAEKRMDTYGHSDGKFLVRERDDCSYALCVSFNKTAKHYKIDVLPSGEFAIQTGQRFPNLMALVRHYMVCSDGLKVVLKEACSKPSILSTQPIRKISDESCDKRVAELPHIPRKKSDTNSSALELSPSHQFAASSSSSSQGFKKPLPTPNSSASNIYSNQPHAVVSVSDSEHMHSSSPDVDKLLKDWEKSSNPRKISLPCSSNDTGLKLNAEIKSQRRLSSPPETLLDNEVMSPTSSKKLLDELHNLSVVMPNDSQCSQSSVSLDSNHQSAHHTDAKSPPVPAPRLSLSSRSRSVDGELLRGEANDGEIPQNSSFCPSTLPNEPPSALLGGFLHKLFGRSPKTGLHHENGALFSGNGNSSDKPESPTKKHEFVSASSFPSEDLIKNVSIKSPERCPNVSKKPLLPPKKHDEITKKDRPLPLPRKRMMKDMKNMNEIKEEFQSPVLTESIADSSCNIKDLDESLDQTQVTKGDGERKSHSKAECSSSQESGATGGIPISEPLYVEIDPSLEEENNEIPTVVSWETNAEYEPLQSSPQLKNTSLSRSASAPGQQPSMIQCTDQNMKTNVASGAKPKISSDSSSSKSSSSKLARSKSISPRSKKLTNDISETEWDDEPRTPPPVPLGARLKRKWSKEKSESIYQTIRRYRKNFINLDRKAIKLEEKIGSGNFGDVMRATYSSSNGDMDLAVKTLKPNSFAKQKV